MKLVWNFIQITLYPVAPILICGFIVWACRRLFVKLLGRGGYQVLMAASVIGTPIHELGHAMMCPLFGHQIVEMVLWQHGSDDGNLGYVRHAHDPDNLYQRLGNLFISTGPIFSGMAVLSLLLFLAFPNTWSAHISSVRALAAEDAAVLTTVSSGLGMISHMIAEFGSGSASVWMRIAAVLVMLSVSLRISLSPQDINGAVNALPPYLMVTLAVTVIVTVLGNAVTGLVLGALKGVCAFLMAMFTVVLVFAAAQVALALLVHLVLSFIRR